MSEVAAFIPQMWDDAIKTGRERSAVFAADCNKEYEGDIRELGDSVKILGLGAPTVYEMTVENSGNNIEAAEDVHTSSITLEIDKIAYCHYKVNNIEKKQAVKGFVEKYGRKAGLALGNQIDVNIANLAMDSTVPKLYPTAIKVVGGFTASGSDKTALQVLDEVRTKILESDIPAEAKVVVTVSPRFLALVKEGYIQRDTDNSDMMANGYVGKYNGMVIKVSNNVCRTQANGTTITEPGAEEGVIDNIMVRTEDAIALAEQMRKSKAYEVDEALDMQAMKHYILYGIKVVEPKEIFNVNVKYA